MATQLSQFYTPYLNCCINWEEKINWRLILFLPFGISVKYELHTKYCFNLSSWTHDSKKKLECWKQYLRRMACVSSNLICWKSCALLKCNYSKTGAAYIIWGDEWRVVTLEGYLFYIILQSIYMLISMGKRKGNLNSRGVRDKMSASVSSTADFGVFPSPGFHLLWLNHWWSSSWAWGEWSRAECMGSLPAGRDCCQGTEHTDLLSRKTAYGGEKKQCEGWDRNVCLGSQSSIIRKHEKHCS